MIPIIFAVSFVLSFGALVLYSEHRRKERENARYWNAFIQQWNSRPDTYVKLANYEDWKK